MSSVVFQILHYYFLMDLIFHRTPLHFAAVQGHSDVVNLLIEFKCKVNLRDDENSTALVMVCGSEIIHHQMDLTYFP